MRSVGVAEAGRNGHPVHVNSDKTESESKMTALTRSLARMGAVLGVVGSAISMGASLRINHGPNLRPAALTGSLRD
jgi:hypothetical protein